MHDFALLAFSLIAVSYFVDRACAIVARRRYKAELTSFQPAVDVACIRMPEPYSGCMPWKRNQALAPGTRWAYVKVPCISQEWHPFSICGTDDAPTIHVK